MFPDEYEYEDRYEHSALPEHYENGARQRGWRGRSVYDQDERVGRECIAPQQFAMWEHELSQPNYYDYFLEEVQR